METLIYAARFMALSQILFFLLALFLSSNPVRVKWTGVSIAIAGVAYLLAPIALENSPIVFVAILWTMASLAPCAILVLTWVVFDERRTIPTWIIVLIFLDIFIEITSHVIWVQVGSHIHDIHQLVVLKRLTILTVSMFLLWKGRESDLVESRKKVRLWVIGSISLVVFLIDFSNILTSYNVPLVVELLSLSILLVVTLAINILFLRFNPELVLVGEPSSVVHDSEDVETQELLSRMQIERLYADHDLRIGKLATLLGIPEYQLRKKINKNLGYRNFNHFINRYRVEEAGTRLKGDSKLAVLTVALDVGFRSISSFNTAFQNHYGVSPTSFRRGEGEVTL